MVHWGSRAGNRAESGEGGILLKRQGDVNV